MPFFPEDEGRSDDVVIRLEVRVPVGVPGVRVRSNAPCSETPAIPSTPVAKQPGTDTCAGGQVSGTDSGPCAGPAKNGTDLILHPIGDGWPAVWCPNYYSAGSGLGYICARGKAVKGQIPASSVKVQIFPGIVNCPMSDAGAVPAQLNTTTGDWWIDQLFGVTAEHPNQHTIMAWAEYTNFSTECDRRTFTAVWRSYTYCSYPTTYPYPCPGDSGGGGAVAALFSGMPLVLPPGQRPSGSPPPGTISFETIPYAWELRSQAFVGAAVEGCNGAWRLKLSPTGGDQIVYRCEGDMVRSPLIELRTDVVGIAPWRLSFALSGRVLLYEAARASFNPLAANTFTLTGMQPPCSQSSLPYILRAEPVFPG